MNTVFSEKLPANSRDASWTFDFDAPVMGRFVRIRQYSYGNLAIAEVIVTPAGVRGSLASFDFADETIVFDQSLHLIRNCPRDHHTATTRRLKQQQQLCHQPAW